MLIVVVYTLTFLTGYFLNAGAHYALSKYQVLRSNVKTTITITTATTTATATATATATSTTTTITTNNVCSQVRTHRYQLLVYLV